MVSICPSKSPLLSRTGHFDVHLSEEKNFTVVEKYFFFQILLYFLGERSRKSLNYSQLQILILNLLAFV